MCHGGRNMTTETQSSCNCSNSYSNVRNIGVIINNVDGLSNFTCHERGRESPYFIKCYEGSSGLEESSSELVIILIGFCLLLTLVSMSLYYKMKKDKKYYKEKIAAFEQNSGRSDSDEQKTSNWKYLLDTSY